MLLSLTAGATLLGGIAAAEAMPGMIVTPAAPAGNVTFVAGGCGPGFHRNVYGGCRRNFYGRGAYFYRRHYGSQRYFYHNF